MKRIVLFLSIALLSLVPSIATNRSAAQEQLTTRNTPQPKAGSVTRNRIGLEMVYVPAGNFMMGSSDAGVQRAREEVERERPGFNSSTFDGVSGSDLFLREQPQHRVTIYTGFYMGRYEVTQSQWKVVMGKTLEQQSGKDTNQPPLSSIGEGDNYPIYFVSWFDAKEFIRKLNDSNDGFTYHLPSEAEWEYACRAGTTGDYSGDIDSMAWYWRNSGDFFQVGRFHPGLDRSNHVRTHPVGQKQPNAYGLYDMYGNVWEWCEDVWHENYNGAPTDGSAWLVGGDREARSLRGGSFLDSPQRSAARSSGAADEVTFFGFRVVATPRS